MHKFLLLFFVLLATAIFAPLVARAALIDDFNRADSATVGNSWSLIGGTNVWDISSNKLRGQPTGSFQSHGLARPLGEASENTQVTVDASTTNPANYPQAWVRITKADSSPTAYVFFLSNTADGVGVLRVVNGVIDGSFTSTSFVPVANRNYRIVAYANTSGSQVVLTLQVLDLDNASAQLFYQTWNDTSANRIVGAGRQGVSAYGGTAGTSAFYDNFNVVASSTPAAITALAAHGEDGQVALTWPTPSAGSSAISDYLIQYRATSTVSWTVWPHTAARQRQRRSPG